MTIIFFRLDFNKFKSAVDDVVQGIEERLRQWVEYESLHDKLVTWLTETEAQLKNYSYRDE